MDLCLVHQIVEENVKCINLTLYHNILRSQTYQPLL